MLFHEEFLVQLRGLDLIHVDHVPEFALRLSGRRRLYHWRGDCSCLKLKVCLLNKLLFVMHLRP